MVKLSKETSQIIELSKIIASELGHSYIGSEHILLALLSENNKNCQTYTILKSFKIDYIDIKNKVISLFGFEENTFMPIEFTSKAKQIVEKSSKVAEEYNALSIGNMHLLLAILQFRDSVAYKLIELNNIKISVLSDTVKSTLENDEIIINEKSLLKRKKLSEIEEKRRFTPTLNKYGKEMLTEYANDKTDPVIGRSKEINRVIEILLRKNKNNPCLIGEPGVGKTAVIEGIAERIFKEDCPEELKDKRIVSIDISSVIAGAKYRGEFEDRIKQIVKEVSEAGNVILFIDEIHNIVGAGAAEGAIDASNILKPSLARSEIRVVGATTIDEYEKYIEKDSALARRFQKIVIEEPTVDETKEILFGLKDRYERYHKLKISDEAINVAVNLSNKYIKDRFLPDKAIDIIDEVSSKKHINGFSTVSGDDVLKCVIEWTGIKEINNDEAKDRILYLEKELNERIIGQSKAVSTILQSYFSIKDNENSRPRASLLFFGPTGVGKTELAKQFASLLYGENSLIKIDMSEYTDRNSISKLIGAPPGYIGYDDNGILSEKVKRKPYSVVLFDEIEKADREVVNILLQILDEGKFTNGKGKIIDFTNTVVVMTSNANSNGNKIGFDNSENKKDKLTDYFIPEIIARIDSVVEFNTLTKDDIYKLSEKYLRELIERYKKVGLNVSFERKILDNIIKFADYKKFGAREVKNYIKENIDNLISKELLLNSNADNIVIGIEKNDIKIKNASLKNKLEKGGVSLYNK